MTDFLKNLQNKPEPIKRVIMWFSVVFFMAIIFGFWIWTWPSSFSSSEETAETKILKMEAPGVWQNLKAQISIFKDLWQK